MAKDKAVRDQHGAWKDMPTVILAEKIKAEPWYVASNGKIEFHPERNAWVVGGYPPSMFVVLQYGKAKLRIRIDWNARKNGTEHFTIYGIKKKSVQTYSNAIHIIMDKIEAALPDLEEESERIEKEENWKERVDSVYQEMGEYLGVQLYREIGYQPHIWAYRPTPFFVMELHFKKGNQREDMDEPLFEVAIGGAFTKEEVRDIMRIVGTNPRAFAERLLR